ncbi:MAG: CBS domain-containing protein [Pseudomonadota bacterium]|nr:CBS domain-containing protein [Pseudomonadota bacterium]
MQVRDVMTQRTDYLNADATIREVALRMRDTNSGFEPLVDGDKIVATLTDRDVAARGVGGDKEPDHKASSIATHEVLYTYEDSDVIDVLKNMQEQHVQRLVVLNNANDKRFSGVVTVGDIANHCDDDETARQIVNCSKSYH